MIKISNWEKFNKLTILYEIFTKSRRAFMCKCDCWNEIEVLLNSIKRWHTKSCWCSQKGINKKHWMSNSKIYWVFKWIQTRCYNPKSIYYKYYWWRWIICEWKTFEDFYTDMWNWYNQWLSIDRIDVNWNYCKENCRWATSKEQNRNQRSNIMYKWKCLTDWCKDLWLNKNTINNRIYNLWWSLEKALGFEILVDKN